MKNSEKRPNGRNSIISGRTKRICTYGLLGLLCVGVGTQCSSKKKQASPVSRSTKSTTTVAHPPTTIPGPPSPLTGIPSTGGTANRCAISVKIGNTQDARPQFGLDATDIVFEEVVDGGITRLVAVFQSQAPTKVGTIRSTRPSDHTIVQPIGGIFAFSGGDPIELAAIQGVSAKLLDETTAGPMMFRDHAGSPPNNLYANVSSMYGACPSGPPQPFFRYRARGAAAAGTPASALTVNYATGYQVSWSWDAASKSWLRSRFGGPDVEANGYRVRAANVVVMSVPYSPSPSFPDAHAVIEGSGPLKVLSAGKVVTGTWNRPDQNKPANLVDDAGKPIELTPGNTWVELPDQSYGVTTTP